MGFLGLQGKGGDSVCFFGSAVKSFLCQRNKGRKKAARERPKFTMRMAACRIPSTGISSLPACVIP